MHVLKTGVSNPRPEGFQWSACLVYQVGASCLTNLKKSLKSETDKKRDVVFLKAFTGQY